MRELVDVFVSVVFVVFLVVVSRRLARLVVVVVGGAVATKIQAARVGPVSWARREASGLAELTTQGDPSLCESCAELAERWPFVGQHADSSDELCTK